MITTVYNPSEIETELAKILASFKDQISAKLSVNTIKDLSLRVNQDNPDVVLFLEDKEGDTHEVVIKIIQRPDKV